MNRSHCHSAVLPATANDEADGPAAALRRQGELLESRTRALATIRECNRALLRATEETELLRRITDLIVKDERYALAWVGVPVSNQQSSIKPVVASGEHCNFLANIQVSWADNEFGRGPTGTAFRTGKTVVARDLTTDPNCATWRDKAMEHGFTASIAMPLSDHGHCIGTLSIYTQQNGLFDADEVSLLEELANDMAFGIVTLRMRNERIQAERKIEHFNKILLAMRRIGQFIGGHVGRNKLLEAVCQDIVGTGLFQASWIGLMENGQFNLAAQAGLDDEIIKLEEYVRENRLPPCSRYVLTKTGPFLGGPEHQFCESCPLSAVANAMRLCIRLEYAGTTYGTWTITGDDDSLGDPQEQALFAEAAKDIALALHNIDLAEHGMRVQEEIRTLNTRLQRHVTQLAALHSIDSAINASMDLSVVLRIIMDEITSQLGADAINIMSYNPRQQILESIASRGFRGETVQRARVRIGQEYAGRVALEHRMVTVIDLSRARADSSDTASQSYAAEGFVSYCGIPLISKGQIRGVLEIYQRATLCLNREWVGFLEAIAGQMAIAIDVANMFENLQRKNFELVVAYDATIEGWSREMDLRDASTQGHCRRVADLAVQLAGKLNLPDRDIVHLRRGALLHDIGKMGIPDSILHKTGPLSEDEWAIMKKHTTYAYEALLPIAFLRPSLDVPYCHHEKWDGSGYPRGLKGELIPLAARIFAVVDVWDAICYDRPYRPAWSKAKALEHMRLLAGNHLDPEIVDAFLEMIVAGEQE